MLNGKKVVVVMPAYNAAKTLPQTYAEIPRDIVDDVLLVDDASDDETVAVAEQLGIRYFVHPTNLGYGGNQKTCYRHALAMGADVVVMVHPDYQYTPRLITAMAAMVASGVYQVALGSRVMGRGALAGGMPLYKFIANRALTITQNICLGQRLTEYHTGYRAFSREVLERLPLGELSDGFAFDNEILVQLIFFGYEIAEITCPAKYFAEASSTGFWRSTQYGLGVLRTTVRCLLARAGLGTDPMFDGAGRTLLGPQLEAPLASSDDTGGRALFPYGRWGESMPAVAAAYARRSPFPHIHLENFLEADLARQLVEEFEEPKDAPWIEYRHYNENKRGLNKRAAFPPVIGRVIDELNSDRFVAWLSALTGIPNLLADPTLEGGGMHECGAAGFLNVHADFTKHHHHRGWRRRVNVILYLNPEWKAEWGGAIELWDKSMARCEVRVPPLFNHAVIFNTDEDSYHGFPDPIACPSGVSRKSLALYYYTEESPGKETVPRSTYYRARPGEGWRKSALIGADRLLIHVYSCVKTVFNLSDDFAGRGLVLFKSGVGKGPGTGIASVKVLEAAFWTIAIVLGAVQAWVTRFQPSSIDLVSYLDVGDAYLQGRWHDAINGYWNPLYSWILASVMSIVRPSTRLEYPTARMADFVIYLACVCSFAWFLKRLRIAYRAGASESTPIIPDWAWIVFGYTVFIWTTVRWITVSANTPDMCGATLAYCAWGIVLALDERTRASRYALLGLVLALGYFSRTPLFIVGCALVASIAFGASAQPTRRGAVIAGAVFLALTIPFIASISSARGHLTIGDNGALNHAWLTNPGSYIIPNHHWQGGPDGNGYPTHPSRVLSDSPAAFEFGTPISGTYPPWTDPSYWYEGLRYHFRAAAEWRSIKHNALIYYQLFGFSLFTGLAVVLLLAGDARATARAAARHARYWIPAAVGLVLYFFADDLLVEVLPSQRPYRYVAVFIAIVTLMAAASIRFRPARRAVWRRALGTALCAISIGMVARVAADQVVAARVPASMAAWEVARDLENAGVAPGTAVATIGSPAQHVLWARLARVRIVAEVPSDASFWSKPLATRKLVLHALAQTGAAVVVSPWMPMSIVGKGWTLAGESNYGVHVLEEDVPDPESALPAP